LPERRELMQRWADWVGQIEAESIKRKRTRAAPESTELQ